MQTFPSCSSQLLLVALKTTTSDRRSPQSTSSLRFFMNIITTNDGWATRCLIIESRKQFSSPTAIDDPRWQIKLGRCFYKRFGGWVWCDRWSTWRFLVSSFVSRRISGWSDISTPPHLAPPITLNHWSSGMWYPSAVRSTPSMQIQTLTHWRSN